MPALAGLLALLAVLLITPRHTRGFHRLQSATAPHTQRTTNQSGLRASGQSAARADQPTAIAPQSGRATPDPATQRRLTRFSERRRLLAIGSADLARSSRRRLGILTATVAVGILLARADPSTLVLTLATASVLAVITRQRSIARHNRTATTRRAAVVEACDVLAAELTAGRPPTEALEGATTACPDLQIASAAAKLGGDVPAALELAAETPGNEGLKALAAAWRVAEESGAAFATITERLAESLRADESIRRQITSTLAGPRATARLLAVLPLFGTFIGYAIGANPLTFLLHTPPGWLCLTLGLLLTITGLHWTNTQSRSPWENRDA